MKTGMMYLKRQLMYEQKIQKVMGDGREETIMSTETYIRLRDELRMHLKAVRNVYNELAEDKRLYPNGVPFLKGKEAGLMDALEVVAKIRTGRL